jgi:choice-of-anchor C domain-containing protein
MGRKKFHIMVLTALALLLAAPPATAFYNILGNGSFETATVDPGAGELLLPTGSTALAPWTVVLEVLYVGGFWQASQGVPGGRSLGLNDGSILQIFTPSLGKMYQVSFDLAGDPTLPPALKAMAITAPSGTYQSQRGVFLFDTTAQTTANMGWATKQWNFWGAQDNIPREFLQFTSYYLTGGGPALDNVVLVPVSTILQNGSFEATSLIGMDPFYALPLPSGSTSIFGWTVGGLGIQLMHDPSVWQASQGSFSLNLNSTSGAGSISQTFTTIPGDLYRVSFDLAGDPGGGLPVKTLRVSAAYLIRDFTFDTTGKTTTNMGWTGQTLTFTAQAATTTLVFQSQDNGANGPALDNVKVVHPANLVLNGSFEQGPAPGSSIQLSPGDDSINGWTVADNGIGYIGGLWQASQGGRSLDMNGVADHGSIEQTFLTTPGVSYKVTFDMAGYPNPSSPLKTLRVVAAGRFKDFTFDTTGKSVGNMGWTTKNFTFTAQWETTTLLFLSLTPGSNTGPALDNVVVTQVSSLPGPYLLLLLD